VDYPATFHELYKVILRDAGRDVSPTIHGEIRTPWQGQIQSEERLLLVAELDVPEGVRLNDGGVRDIVGLQLQHSRPLLCRLLSLRIALLIVGAISSARMLCRARRQRFCKKKKSAKI
jgi:hypothetical protein